MKKIMVKGLIDFVFEAPNIEVPFGHCSMYARKSAEKLTDTLYVPGHAWDLGKKNKIVEKLSNETNLKDYADLLFPGETIVLFYNIHSDYNKKNRVGTHASIYLGREDDLIFGQEYLGKILTLNYQEMKDLGLFPRQILAPKISPKL
jgi:hypothetical protein